MKQNLREGKIKKVKTLESCWGLVGFSLKRKTLESNHLKMQGMQKKKNVIRSRASNPPLSVFGVC